MRSVLAIAFICASAWVDGAAGVMTYDGNKGYHVSTPVLAKSTKCTAPPKTKELNLPALTLRTITTTTAAPASACDSQALKDELPKVLEQLIANKLKNQPDPKLQCFFNDADMQEVKLEKYVQVANFIGTNKLCLWSGLTTKNSQDYIDNKHSKLKSGCMRLENTPLGNFLEENFNEKAGIANYPNNSLECHKKTDWEVGGTRWPGLKLEGMHFLRALWNYASKHIALQVGSELTTILNKAGNFKGFFNGDVFSLVEFPALVKEGKVKKIHVQIFDDPTDFSKDKPTELRKRLYDCNSKEFIAMRTDAISDLKMDPNNFTCDDKIKL